MTVLDYIGDFTIKRTFDVTITLKNAPKLRALPVRGGQPTEIFPISMIIQWEDSRGSGWVVKSIKARGFLADQLPNRTALASFSPENAPAWVQEIMNEVRPKQGRD